MQLNQSQGHSGHKISSLIKRFPGSTIFAEIKLFKYARSVWPGPGTVLTKKGIYYLVIITVQYLPNIMNFQLLNGRRSAQRVKALRQQHEAREIKETTPTWNNSARMDVLSDQDQMEGWRHLGA